MSTQTGCGYNFSQKEAVDVFQRSLITLCKFKVFLWFKLYEQKSLLTLTWIDIRGMKWVLTMYLKTCEWD